MKTTEEKIEKLKRITHLLLQFSNHFKDVHVITDKDSVVVKWCSPKPTKKGTYHEFDMKEVPITDLDAAIARYEEKISYELKKRNNTLVV